MFTHRSQALQTGDRILSINGTSTEHLMRSEIAALLDNAGNVVNLEIAYEASPGIYHVYTCSKNRMSFIE